MTGGFAEEIKLGTEESLHAFNRFDFISSELNFFF